MKLLNLICHLAVIAISACADLNNESADKVRPNLLFIMSADHAYKAITAYDDRLILTPKINPAHLVLLH